MKLGLIGKSLVHSFSRNYFLEKFRKEKLHGYSYENFELPEIDSFPLLLQQQPDLRGLNVTIPYKETIIPYLDDLSAEAEEIGAINTIKIYQEKLLGYNTDVYGFGESLKPQLQPHIKQALVLGSGGASKAVRHTLSQLGIRYLVVSRQPGADQLSYKEASGMLDQFQMVVNTTPLGTWPSISEMPPLDLARMPENALFYDLIYNPAETLFLQEAKTRGAKTLNGQNMLELQAEKAWEIWHEI